MTRGRWKVHKFGGTSVADAERIRASASIVRREGAPAGVVVSALAGVTDKLIRLVSLAAARDESYIAELEALKKTHLDVVGGLGLDAGICTPIREAIESEAADLKDVLKAAWLGRSAGNETIELVSGYGELWSARIFHGELSAGGSGKARWLDARAVLVVENTETGPYVQWDETRARFSRWLAEDRAEEPADLLVITGFIASTPAGVPTTLKRNGSDYSAAVFGNLLDASEITIWKDVDGILSADPRRVPEAVLVPRLSYEEAVELAYFGAKVLHPGTIEPAAEKGIPIRIRSSFNPSAPGSVVGPARKDPEARRYPVKGFSSVERVALINVEGTGMMGVPGVAHRLFGALREVGVSVILISQASSEHSICFAVPWAQGEKAESVVKKTFRTELEHALIERVDRIGPCSIIAAVGDGMVESPGVAGRFFTALGGANVNIRAIAQGSSERNISLVVDGDDSSRALRAAHSAFYLSEHTVSVGVIGPGLIGATLLDQLRKRAPALESRRVDLRLRAIANSSRMALDDVRIPQEGWRDALSRGEAIDLRRFAQHVRSPHVPHWVIVDCSASAEVAAMYPEWLSQGIHVVTPNKKAGSGPMALYRAIREARAGSGARFYYEATVGAGLPVISTLKDLIGTGDEVIEIQGVFSGTLSYLFNTLAPGASFAEAVRRAKDAGYTEPDPRDDLSGMDVARKLVILAREMGLELEPERIQVENLVPEALRDPKKVPVDAFLDALAAHDPGMAARLDAASAAGRALRYVGRVTASGAASVELMECAGDHPFSRLGGSDNMILFRTRRYDSRPLVVQGPGAGPEVTAGGIFADLLRLVSTFGAAT